MSHSTVIDVGNPSPGFKRLVESTTGSAEVRFHGFADLPAERGDFVKSPEFTCLGHRWTLFVYPGGDDEGRGDVNGEQLLSMYVSRSKNLGPGNQ